MTLDDALESLLETNVDNSISYQPFVISPKQSQQTSQNLSLKEPSIKQDEDIQQLNPRKNHKITISDYIKHKQLNKLSNLSNDSYDVVNIAKINQNRSCSTNKSIQRVNEEANNKFNSFLTRNQHAQQLKRQNLEQLKQHLYSNDTFQPKINYNSQRIVQQIHERKPYEVIEQEKQRKIEGLREQQFKSTCTFQPTINVNSREISKQMNKPSIFDYEYQVQQKQKTHDQIKEKIEQQESLELTYKPQIVQLPEYLNGQLLHNFNLEEHYQQQAYKYQQRMKQLDNERQRQQMIEDQECTFKPNIYQNKVKGLNYTNIVQRLKQEEEKLKNIM